MMFVLVGSLLPLSGLASDPTPCLGYDGQPWTQDGYRVQTCEFWTNMGLQCDSVWEDSCPGQDNPLGSQFNDATLGDNPVCLRSGEACDPCRAHGRRFCQSLENCKYVKKGKGKASCTSVDPCEMDAEELSNFELSHWKDLGASCSTTWREACPGVDHPMGLDHCDIPLAGYEAHYDECHLSMFCMAVKSTGSCDKTCDDAFTQSKLLKRVPDWLSEDICTKPAGSLTNLCPFQCNPNIDECGRFSQNGKLCKKNGCKWDKSTGCSSKSLCEMTGPELRALSCEEKKALVKSAVPDKPCAGTWAETCGEKNHPGGAIYNNLPLGAAGPCYDECGIDDFCSAIEEEDKCEETCDYAFQDGDLQKLIPEWLVSSVCTRPEGKYTTLCQSCSDVPLVTYDTYKKSTCERLVINGKTKKYKNIEAAKIACAKNENCSGLVDFKCKEKALYLCDASAEDFTVNRKYCVHEKISE